MVAEKRHDADEEQGRHEKQEQYVEFGVCVRQLFLKKKEKRSSQNIFWPPF